MLSHFANREIGSHNGVVKKHYAKRGKHAKNMLSGHGHNMTTPGNLASGHLPQNHIHHLLVPNEYKVVPLGINYSTPLGF